MAVITADGLRTPVDDAGASPRERRWEHVAMRVGFIATGVLLMDMAYRSWVFGQVAARHNVVWLIFMEYALAFGLLAIGVMSIERMRRLVPLIALATIFAFVTWSYIQIHIAYTIYGTDNAALSHVAAEKLMAGHNPYSINDRATVIAAAQRFGVPETFITDTTGGQPISNLMSWPSGSVLVLVPALAAGVHDVRWVVVAFEAVAFILIWFRAPAVLRPLALLPLTIDPDLFIQFTGGGVMDYIWVTPMVACAIALYSGRLGWSALFYGLAAGIKQQPWLLAPFLAVYVWQTQKDGRRLSSVVEYAGIAAAAFLALNLPFMLWDFSGWIRGVLLPIHERLVPFGSGVSLLTTAGIADLPKSFYTAATLGVAAVLVIAYMLHFRNLKHSLWLAPAVIMWFGYRSMQNYFVYWAPVVLIALFVWWEEMEHVDADEAVEA